MRKSIGIIILVLFAVSVHAQSYVPVSTYGYQWKRGKFDIALLTPQGTGNTLPSDSIRNGAIRFNPVAGYLQVWKDGIWINFATGTGLALDSVRRSNDTLFFRYTTGGELAVKVPPGSLQQVTDIGNVTTNEIVLTGADSLRDVDGLHLLKNTFWSGNLYRGTKDYFTMQMSDFVLGASGQANYSAHNMLFTSDSLIRLQGGKGIMFYTSDGITPATFNTRVNGVNAILSNEFLTRYQGDSTASSLRDSLIRNQFSYEQNANAWIKNFQSQRIGIGRASAPYRLFDVYGSNKSLLAWDGKTLIVSSDTAIGLNTNVGYNAGVGNTGVQNVYLGSSAGLSAVGSDNVGIGYAGGYTVKGDRNSFLGWGAGGNTDSSDIVSVGFSNMLNVNGYNNSSLGSSVLIDSTVYLSSDTIRTSDLLSNSYTGSTISARISALQLHNNTTYAIKTTWLDTPPTTSLGNSAFVKVRIDTINGKLIGLNSFPGIDTGYGRLVVNIIPHKINVSAIGYRAKIDADNQVILGNENVTQIKSGKIRISVDDNPNTGDVLTWNGTEYIPSVSSSVSAVVADIPALQAYSGVARSLVVTDSVRGAIFYYTTSPQTIDNGVVFAATGKGTGYWVRQYNPGLGVNVDWWGGDSYAILSAVNYTTENGIVNFGPGKTYLQYDAIVPKKGQSFVGNRATLKRAPETIVTLASDAATAGNTIVVSSVPAIWKIGDNIQLFLDSTAAGSIKFYRKITAISGTTITLSDSLGTNESYYSAGDHTPVSPWPSGTTKVRKVFAQFTSPTYIQNGSYVYNFTIPNHFNIDNLIIDGNKANNNGNFYWAVNSGIFNMGFQTKITRCNFFNMPNDCMNGHGFFVEGCIGKNLNGSFFHTSASDTVLPKQIPTIIVGNYTDSTNLKPTAGVNGHSRGTIEFSFSGGYLTVANNRFNNGGTTGSGVFGYFSYAADTTDAGSREIIITGNYAKNYPLIAYNNGFNTVPTPRVKLGHIFLSGNTFDNCGTNNWSGLTTSAATIDTVRVGDNALFGNTTWTIPNTPGDGLTRFITNSSTGLGQPASINISGSAIIGGNSTIGGTSTHSADFVSAVPVGANFGSYIGKWLAVGYNAGGGFTNMRTKNTSRGKQVTYLQQGASIFMQGPAAVDDSTSVRPEISMYRGANAYPEFTIKEHTSSGSGGEIWAGTGSTAPTIVTEFIQGSTPFQRIPATARLAIGSVTPSAQLHLSGTAKFDLGSDATGDIFYRNSSGNFTRLGIGSTGNVVTVVAGLPAWAAPATNGTVTSVGLSLPSFITVTGSPVTTTGTITGTLATQTANTVFAGPSSGGVVAPTFRALVAADIPSLDAAKITTGTLPIARGGTGLAALGTPLQQIRVNAGATAIEYFTPSAGGNVTPLKDVYTDQGNSSSTPNNYTALHTFNVAANTLSANGQKILMTSGGNYSATVGTKDLQLFINGNGCGTFLSTSVSDGWHMDVFFIRTGTTTGRVIARVTGGTALSDAIETDLTGLDYTGAITFAVWGASGTGTINDVTAKLTRWVFEQAAP